MVSEDQGKPKEVRPPIGTAPPVIRITNEVYEVYAGGASADAVRSRPHVAEPLWRFSVKLLVQVLVAGGTLALAAVAYRQGCEAKIASTAALEEAQSMRFADNMPFFKISPQMVVQGDTAVPVLGLTLENVGKGPGFYLGIGLSEGPCDAVYHEDPLKECVPVSGSQNISRLNFDELARKYAEKRALPAPKGFAELVTMQPQAVGGETEYFIQFADAFKNLYRQHFFYEGSTMQVVCYGRFERGPCAQDGQYAHWDLPKPRRQPK
jgi:hypothetical protein